jgi:DNA ligase-1
VKAFAELYTAIDETNATTEKVSAMVRYFTTVPPADAAWAVHFLSGRRPKRLVGGRKMYLWAAEEAEIPEWLFDESYHAVGDLAETISLLMPDAGPGTDRSLAYWVEERLLPLRSQDEAIQRAALIESWRELAGQQRYVWNKLITGGFRVGVSQQLLVRALAQSSGVPESTIAHRLMGGWEPNADTFLRLISADSPETDISKPYPFYLAHPLETEPASLGLRSDWQAEWKWDGIRAQLVRRQDRCWLWSRGEELLAGRFPEIEQSSALLPDGTVVDGEVLPWKDGPLPFALLQRRIGRKKLSPAILDEVPVVLLCFDLLELGGQDRRAEPLEQRRGELTGLLQGISKDAAFALSPLVHASSWEELLEQRQHSRELGTEGVMLKRLASAYGVGRKRGDWWKWKIAPLSVDAVLMYAQPGSGRRAGLFTDYTFGIWKEGQLVPFAKAYSGLTDEEIRKVDNFVRRNTLARYGPVRTVKPQLVFELAFERILPSSRHKSGVAVRFPRMARWRTDKKPEEADTLETLRGMMHAGDMDRTE